MVNKGSTKRLPVIKGRDLIRALKKAGFKVVRQKGSHVRMVHTDQRKTTIPIHSGEQIGKGLLAKILRDCELTKEQLIELLD